MAIPRLGGKGRVRRETGDGVQPEEVDRHLCTFKVAVAGAAGGIGQPLALLLKLDPNVKQLSLFDVVRTPGVAADISHCCSPAEVSGYVGMEQAHDALEGCDVVVIPAGKLGQIARIWAI